jgi:ABC-2 type transport system ATP-binding protein
MGATIASMKAFYKELYDFNETSFRRYAEAFELTEDLHMANLSKGMKRRAALLFALSVQPDLILLDEAYDGLEPIARLRFKQILADLVEERKITVIISSHNLRELEDICDSYGILEEGKMLTYGDLLTSRENVSKYQLAFAEEKTAADFKDFDVMHFTSEGRVVQLVIKGNPQETEAMLKQMNPLLMDVLQVTFEELFIYEVESRGEKLFPLPSEKQSYCSCLLRHPVWTDRIQQRHIA